MAPRVINAVPNAIHEMGRPTNAGALSTEVFATNPCCRMYEALVAVANSAPVTVGFSTEEYDVGGMHSLTVNTSRVTIAVAGVYLLVAQAKFDGSANGYALVDIVKNGAVSVASAKTPNKAGDLPIPVAVGAVKLAAGDYVEVRLFQASGGALNAGDVYFSAARVAGG